MKQLALISRKEFRARKTFRPISTCSPNHVILKSRVPVLRAHHQLIRKLVRETQLRYGVRLRSISIMENHIHFLIGAPTRRAFANFLRVLAGGIALKLRRGKLWRQRVWSRIVHWGRDCRSVARYIQGNPVRAGCFDGTDVFRISAGILESG